MAPKTVGLIGAACLSAGWLVASLLTPPVARLQSLPERRSGAAPRADAPPLAAPPLLPLGAPATSEPPVARRNPFMYGRRATPESGGARATAAAEGSLGALSAPASPAVVAPSFTLAGIAATGDVRTAVLSDGSSVHLVTTGETIGAYKVVAVSDDSVTLADPTGEIFVMRLR